MQLYGCRGVRIVTVGLERIMNSKISQYFDSLSGIYDEVAGTSDSWSPPEILAEQISALNIEEFDWLDIGIGTGLLQERLVTTKAKYRLEGVEVSEKMSEMCQKKLPDALLHNGDFLDIDFEGKSFDLITACGSLEFIQDLRSAIIKITSLLNKGGHAIFTYEPIIIRHKLQTMSSSETTPSDSKFFVPGFMTYRHHPTEVIQLLDEVGLHLKQDVEFIAYRKLDVDIIYHSIVSTKGEF